MNIFSEEKHTEWSSLREEYLEYAFLGELCRVFWQKDLPVDVLRSHTDRSGFDVVLEMADLQRHIQLKSSFLGSRTSTRKVNTALEAKTGGCVVWIFLDKSTLSPQHFLWFGSPGPTSKMPSLGTRRAKHTKANSLGFKAERKNIRTLNKGDFERLNTFDHLADRLFPATASPTIPSEEEIET